MVVVVVVVVVGFVWFSAWYFRRRLLQEYSQGYSLTQHFFNGGRSKHANSIYLCVIPCIQLCINNTDATLVMFTFPHPRQYKICVNIDPWKVLMVFLCFINSLNDGLFSVSVFKVMIFRIVTKYFKPVSKILYTSFQS